MTMETRRLARSIFQVRPGGRAIVLFHVRGVRDGVANAGVQSASPRPSLRGHTEQPVEVFESHRLLAKRAPELGPGFWIRFTVHYNLFAGTVVALGSEEHFDVLETASKRGEIGCFCLTEKYAGVNSGLVVETTAEYDEKTKEFVFHSNSEGAKKNWISQGLVADWAVIVARLKCITEIWDRTAFLCRVREEGTKEVKRGIAFGDMGRKTIGNDLDNAWVKFDGFRCERGCLLNRYADVLESNGAYVRKGGALQGGETMNQMNAIGQRLFTGRVAVAKAALTFCEEVFKNTKKYSDEKLCAMRGTNKTLSHVPQLKALYEEAETRLKEMSAFVTLCKDRLSPSVESSRNAINGVANGHRSV